MNIKGFTSRVVSVSPEVSAALMARQAAQRRLLDEREAARLREQAERDARVKAAADEGWRRLCAEPTRPDNVTSIEEARR